jgi:hypothetical protein
MGLLQHEKQDTIVSQKAEMIQPASSLMARQRRSWFGLLFLGEEEKKRMKLGLR